MNAKTCKCCQKIFILTDEENEMENSNLCDDCQDMKKCSNCDNWFHIDEIEHDLCENCMQSYRIENDMESTYESLMNL
jgi:hypothetical protein